MRNIFLLSMILILVACQEQPKKKVAESKQQLGLEIPAELLGKDWEGNEILVGKVSTAQMKYYTRAWMDLEYDRYPTNSELIQQLIPLLKGKQLTLLMGTWCEDSQREVPGMLKILDQVEYPTEALQIIAVDEDKSTPDQLEKAFNLLNVPTLIIAENGREINRIVEFPIESLEKDLLAILTRQGYQNAYAE